jgi:hypothetical protein
MLKLTFVNRQPMRRRSKKPSRRVGAGNGPSPVEDGTVGGGDHMRIGVASGAAYINPSGERQIPGPELHPILLRRRDHRNLESSHEKLLKKTEITRRPAADETLFAGLEEARKDALEVAQEADAPPQARAEDASAVRPRRLDRSTWDIVPHRSHG